ncbi:hypothetical protein Emag_002169 [Eimeria magna]
MSQTPQPLQQVPPEPPFQTTNGLYWTLKCQGKELAQLPSGPAEIPVYAQLGSGQFGRVFEVLPSLPPSHPHSTPPAGSAAPAAIDLAKAAVEKPQSPGPAAPGTSTESWGPPSSLPPRQLYAAKLLPLSNFAGHGTTADLLREFSLYRELDTPAAEESSFANILRVYGIASCVTFSKSFADAYLSGVQTAGVLVVEQCASDLAAFAMRLQAQGKLNHSALKFYAWQLLNARLHGRGVVHRDLKPENILVAAPAVPGGQQLLRDGVGILKIADLGLGRKIRSLLGQEPAGLRSRQQLDTAHQLLAFLLAEESVAAEVSAAAAVSCCCCCRVVAAVAFAAIAAGAIACTSASSLPVREDPHNKQQQQQQQQVEQQQQQQEEPQQRGPQDGRSLCMRQSGRVVTLPYRPPEILAATASNQSAAKLPVASYSSACDMWSLGVILLELCLPQKAPRPHMWNFAFILHTVGRAAFQMEFMILENILKVLGKPKEQEEVLDMIRLAGDQRADLLSFVGAFPSLSHSERKMAILDYIAEKGGLHLDALGLDLLARLLHVSPSHRLSAHCALSHPWFHDLPFDQMNRLGLSFHLSDPQFSQKRKLLASVHGAAAFLDCLGVSAHADLEIPALRASLPSPLRRCLTTWEARGRCPSSTRFACHELLQQALLQQQHQQQQQQQQQRSRCCSNSDVLPVEETRQQLKYPETTDDAAAGHESLQQQQQQQQQAPFSSRRSGENNRRSGCTASGQKLRNSNSSHSSAKALPAASAAARQQTQAPSSGTGSSLSLSRPGSAKSLRSSGPATLQRRSSSSMNRRSESLSREQPKQKAGDGGPPAGAPPSTGVLSGTLTRGAQGALSLSGRQRVQRQKGAQLRHREQEPFRTELREGQQCAGSDDEVVRSPWRCARPAAVSASTSVLQSLPPHPSLTHKGPPLPGRPPLRASSAIITAAAVAATARKKATTSPTKCQRAAATLECRSGNSTPYHDALSDHSCSPSRAPSAAATAPVSAAPSDGANENVDSSQDPAALCCPTATSGTKSRRRGPQGPPSKAPAEDQVLKGASQALAVTGPSVDADGKEQKTLRRAKRLRRGSGTAGHCFP